MKTFFKKGGEPLSLEEIKSKAKDLTPTSTRRSGTDGQRCVPPLPSPKKPKTDKRVAFYRPETEVIFVGAYLFGDEPCKAEEIGGACFDRVLEEATKATKAKKR
jgi:hypothetical protein